MSSARNVGVFVGSLRKESFNRKIASALMTAAPPSLATSFVEIGDLPLYNLDLEASVPPAWAAFRQRVHRLDALLFVTPEHNRGIPAAMKNAIDVGSLPRGQNAWAQKPAGIVSVTPGPLGAMASHHALRQTLFAVGVPVMPSPEMYIGGVEALLGPDGSVTNASTRELLVTFMAALATWTERMLAAPDRSEPSRVLE